MNVLLTFIFIFVNLKQHTLELIFCCCCYNLFKSM